MSNNFTGFYLSFGSRDFPHRHSWTEPFGYDENSTTPRYKYSLTDVINYFETPTQLIRNSPMNNNENSLFIVNASKSELEGININDIEWNKVYQMLDCIYNNPILYATPPVVNSLANNYGDEVFRGDVASNTAVELNLKNFYEDGSFTCTSFGSQGRIVHASFKVVFVGKGTVTIGCYFNPDYLIEQQGTPTYKVYTYKDLDGNFEISSEEFTNQIINKIHTILKSGKYKRVDTYSTRRVTDPTSIEAGYTVMQDFYIFSNISQLSSPPSNDKLQEAIRQYLENDYVGSDREDDLQRWYPDLYIANKVSIRPFYNYNAVNIGGVNTVMHALDGESLDKMKNSINLVAGVNSKKFEIFYVGASTSNNYLYRWPILAVEESRTSSVKRPVSSRFPRYIPKWGYSTENIEDDADKFHLFLLTALNILLDGYSTLDTIPMEYKSMGWEMFNNNNAIRFNFKNVTWEVYGPTSYEG